MANASGTKRGKHSGEGDGKREAGAGGELQSVATSGLMSVKAAAAYLGIAPNTLRDWIYNLRALPWYRIGAKGRGKPMFKRADLDRFIESRKGGRMARAMIQA